MNKPFEVVDLGPAIIAVADNNYVCCGSNYGCTIDYVCCGTGTKIINR